MPDATTRTDPVIARVAPGIASMRSYERGWLRQDLVAGLVLTALLVPQRMAYAELAGPAADHGAIHDDPVSRSATRSSDRPESWCSGTDSSLGPMIAASIIPLAAAKGDLDNAVAYASLLALMVGAITVLAGIFKLGFVADLLSKPTQIGYMNGLALTIVIGQLPKLFGFSVDADDLIDEANAFVQGLPTETQWKQRW